MGSVHLTIKERYDIVFTLSGKDCLKSMNKYIKFVSGIVILLQFLIRDRARLVTSEANRLLDHALYLNIKFETPTHTLCVNYQFVDD